MTRSLALEAEKRNKRMSRYKDQVAEELAAGATLRTLIHDLVEEVKKQTLITAHRMGEVEFCPLCKEETMVRSTIIDGRSINAAQVHICLSPSGCTYMSYIQQTLPAAPRPVQ